MNSTKKSNKKNKKNTNDKTSSESSDSEVINNNEFNKVISKKSFIIFLNSYIIRILNLVRMNQVIQAVVAVAMKKENEKILIQRLNLYHNLVSCGKYILFQ